MEAVQARSGECPHCLSQLKIVSLTFSLTRTRIVFACPNCAEVFADELPSLEQGGIDSVKNPVKAVWALLRKALSMMEPLNARFRYVVIFTIAAVVVAVVLRHTAHTYAGFSREEIRAGALVTCLAISLAFIFWRNRRRR